MKDVHSAGQRQILHLLTDTNGPVATVTLNRPDVHNAFDEALIGGLTDAFVHLAEDASIRVVVLTGTGTSFCAGGDLAWMRRMAGYSQEENVRDAHLLQQMFTAIADCPKVTIARVHGAAMGGGAGLVAACDVAIAAEDATFAFSEVRLGLAPATIAPYVVQKIGMGAARALFVTGQRFGAQEALRLGLVQQVTPTEELDEAVDKAVRNALGAGPEAVSAIKRLLREIDGKTAGEVADVTTECIAGLRVSPEGQEGIRAFLGKRKPEWTP